MAWLRRRRLLEIAVLGASSALLASCSSGPTPTTLGTRAYASILGARTAELRLTLTSNVLPSGPLGPVTNAARLVDNLAVDVVIVSDGRETIAAAKSRVASAVTVTYQSRPLFEVVETSPTALYLTVAAANWAHLPLSASLLARLTTVANNLDGRWYRLPTAGVGSDARSDLTHAIASFVGAFERQTRYTSTGSLAHSNQRNPTTTKFTATGSLDALVRAAAPAIARTAQALGHPIPENDLSIASSTGGSYQAELFTGATSVLNALVASLSIGAVTATLTMVVSHPSTSVPTPKSATPLPAGVLRSVGLGGFGG